jgi:CDP-diacylglycerol--glycerol-3-phosphate 3-phosphatidyltransferase
MTLRTIASLAPAVALFVGFMGGAVVFALLRRKPDLPGGDRRPESLIVGRFWTQYVLRILRPVEDRLAAGSASPHALTLASLLASVAAAALIAGGLVGAAAFAFCLSGVFDVLDGRIARRLGKSSAEGAFFDSVADRWGEFVVLGALVFLHAAWLPGLVAALILVIGSQMVSYTRARGESLGLSLNGGTMQRTERIVLLSLGMIFSEVGFATGAWPARWPLFGAIVLVGVWSTGTAMARLASGMRALSGPKEKPAEAPHEASSTDAAA